MKHALIALVATLSAGHAAASGYYYAGASGGESKYAMDSYSTVLTQPRDNAHKVFGGIELAPQVAAEMGYVSLGTSEGSFEGIPARFRTDTLYVAVVGSFPLLPNMWLTGKLGTTGSTTRVEFDVDGEVYRDQTETSSPMAGIGLRIDLGANVALVAEYEHFGRVAESDESEELSAGVATVGLRFAF